MGLHIQMYVQCIWDHWDNDDTVTLIVYMSVGALSKIEWTQDGQLLTSSLKNGKHSECICLLLYSIYISLWR